MFLHERIRLEQMAVLMMTNQFKKPKMYIFLFVLISLINSTLPAVLAGCFHEKTNAEFFKFFKGFHLHCK